MEEIEFHETGCFGAHGHTLETPAQKLLVQNLSGLVNFIKICSFHLKLFDFFLRTDRHMDKHLQGETDTCTESYKDSQTHGQAATRTDRHMDKHTDKWTDKHMGRHMGKWTDS